jgi:hypothetical protein
MQDIIPMRSTSVYRCTKDMRSKDLSELLAQSDEYHPLMQHAQLLLDLRKALPKVLPGELARYCSIANYKNGRLVVFADNNAVAAKLKLLAAGLPAKLSGHLQATGNQVTAVAIEVQPRYAAPVAARKSAQLSEASANVIARFCDRITDENLRNAMKTLASRAEKRPAGK